MSLVIIIIIIRFIISTINPNERQSLLVTKDYCVKGICGPKRLVQGNLTQRTSVLGNLTQR